jgi:hypothetical protein
MKLDRRVLMAIARKGNGATGVALGATLVPHIGFDPRTLVPAAALALDLALHALIPVSATYRPKVLPYFNGFLVILPHSRGASHSRS